MSDTDSSTKRCFACGEIKPLDAFHRNRRAADGRNYKCIECHKAYVVANKDRITAHNKAYYREHQARYRARAKEKYREDPQYERYRIKRRRAQVNGVPNLFTFDDYQAMLKSQEGKCAYCEAALEDDHHIDHMVPLGRGGTDASENIAIVCPNCNYSKGSLTLTEYCNSYKYDLRLGVKAILASGKERFTLDEAGAALGVHGSTVRRWVLHGGLAAALDKGVRGQAYYIAADALIARLEAIE